MALQVDYDSSSAYILSFGFLHLVCILNDWPCDRCADHYCDLGSGPAVS